ncbi:tetratricopeptide repeat protein [Belliella sp. R4-6]|uniref:Tetratricopeptide repeat protein n=1 Tax=Belliella alkalica TaxID=1730871 RepID=A0ABS9VCP8_9BACT|nr:tetratricopeptide repeat protein [Belliella alkalica]MCH7414201.1 tetratricopeptide repeat protein [Belliella alkalica]
MIKYYFVLFFLIGVLFFIHTVECFSKTTGYESIQEEYLLIRNSVDFEKATVYLLDVLGSKEAQSDLELRIWSQIHLANVLWASGRFDESYSYLQKIEKSIDLIDNNYLKSLFHQEYSQYYYQLGFINLSLQRNKEAISYAKTIKDTGLQKRILSYVYATRKVMFNALAQEDSALQYPSDKPHLF